MGPSLNDRVTIYIIKGLVNELEMTSSSERELDLIDKVLSLANLIGFYSL